jgi:phasin family protein
MTDDRGAVAPQATKPDAKAGAKQTHRNKTEKTMKNGTDAFAKNYESFIDFGNGNVEAVVEASKIYASGVEKITQEVVNGVKTSVEENLAATKAVMACTDPKEWVDMQARQAGKFFDAWLAQGAKISEMSADAFAKAAAPINQRFNETVEKVVKTAA